MVRPLQYTPGTNVIVSRDLKVVAEGVETVEMWNLMSSLGVDEAQGFLMARPMEPTAFSKLLKEGLPELQKAIAA